MHARFGTIIGKKHTDKLENIQLEATRIVTTLSVFSQDIFKIIISNLMKYSSLLF